MKTSIIYMATNLVNGKSYVGRTVKGLEHRRKNHIWAALSGKGKYFHRAIRKYGKDSFGWEVLCECKNKNLLKVWPNEKLTPQLMCNVASAGKRDNHKGYKCYYKENYNE